MKKYLLLVIVALIAAGTPVLAQEATIALYFSFDEGVTYSRYSQVNEHSYEAYVMIYAEDIVYGAKYRLEIEGTDVLFLGETYPDGIHIGSVLTGVEIGLTDAVYGYMGEPVLMTTVLMYNDSWPKLPNTLFTIHPLNEYEDFPYYVGNAYQLCPLTALRSMLGDSIANEELTWGNVKTLYR